LKTAVGDDAYGSVCGAGMSFSAGWPHACLSSGCSPCLKHTQWPVLLLVLTSLRRPTVPATADAAQRGAHMAAPGPGRTRDCTARSADLALAAPLASRASEPRQRLRAHPDPMRSGARRRPDCYTHWLNRPTRSAACSSRRRRRLVQRSISETRFAAPGCAGASPQASLPVRAPRARCVSSTPCRVSLVALTGRRTGARATMPRRSRQEQPHGGCRACLSCLVAAGLPALPSPSRQRRTPRLC